MKSKYALVGAKIFTVSGEVIEKGTIAVENGKIFSVSDKTKAPKGYEEIDLKGCCITPGLIDAHCHVGVFNEGVGEVGNDGNDYSNPVTPHIKAADGIYTDDEAFLDALEHGITTLCIGPGSANVIGGQIAVVKCRSNILEEMMLTDYVGLKAAFGENPKRVYGASKTMPTTRMGVGAVLRKTLVEVINYKAKKEHHFAKPEKEGEPKAPFEVDYQKEIILEVLEGRKPLRAHAHRADDIQTAIRIAEEFGYKVVIEHGTEAHKIADWLAKKGVTVIIGPLNYSKTKVELRDASMEAPVILHKAGVKFAIMTDAPVKKIGNLFDDVRLCVRHGLSKDAALKAVTLIPAEILGYSDRLGSLEKGKDADFAVFEGDPFDFMSKVKATVIDGKVVFGKL
ncbi:MAG: amidohydrolase [Planctomycetota bacterium]